MARTDRRLDPAVAAVRAAVRRHLGDLEPGQRVLVACSGGADSLALAACTVFEAGKAGWLVGAIVVDHGLQAGSAQVARSVATQLHGMECEPVDVVTADVGSDGGPEAAARQARYAALESVVERWGHAAVVLLGHTRDDQAETVLLGLARGSGTRSLAGMACVTGRYRRPLLDIDRGTTRAACAALGLEVWDDPHNTDTRFARVRVRQAVLPVLEREIGPGVAAALARSARLARDDADALDLLASRLFEEVTGPEGALDAARLATAVPAVRARVLRAAGISAGCPPGELFAVHIDALTRLVTHWTGQRGVDLPGQVLASRQAGRLHFDVRRPDRPQDSRPVAD
ncbi:MAG: tRNA lysidine(34) synthetase TilS [Nocardioidaceae bacterium]